MFIALSNSRGVNTLDIDDVELVGDYEIMEDNGNNFIVFFEDDRQFHIDFDEQTVTVMLDDDVLLHEHAGSLEFLNTIAEEIRNGFPRYAGYTNTDFNNFVPDNNSQATQSLNGYASNNSNTNYNRLSVLSNRSMNRRMRRSSRNTRRLRRARSQRRLRSGRRLRSTRRA
jgi:hypothetical protein